MEGGERDRGREERSRSRSERENGRERNTEEKQGKQEKAKHQRTSVISPGFLFGRALPVSTPTYDTSRRLGGACDGGPGEDVGSPMLPPRAIGRRGEFGAIEESETFLVLSCLISLIASTRWSSC